jgi:hypothetical protein
VAAREFCRALFGGNEVGQNTVAAGAGFVRRIVVNAAGGVFEDVFGPPSGLGRTAIAMVFEEFEFRFQNV